MLDGAQLIAAMFASLIGMALMVYGKKQRRIPQLVVGVVMLVFPYFVSSALVIAVISAILLAAMAIVIRAGA